MSYQSEHQRLKPVLDLARQLDIATNPEPGAIFEAGNGGFQVWCTPQDRPRGWDGIVMNSGAFSIPCEYVGSAHWKWDDEKIVVLEIETAAYALADQKPDEYCNLTDVPKGINRRTIVNREEDLEWLKEKVAWLFQTAGVPLLPFEHEPVAPSSPDPYLLVHYLSGHDEYVVIVSSDRDPQEFCQRGFEIASTLEIADVDDMPTDVVLHPERDFPEPDMEQESDGLAERLANATRSQPDDWLEADFEDRISGPQE